MSVACAVSIAAFRGYTPTGHVVVGDSPQLEL
jgi:hypothetical protein